MTDGDLIKDSKAFLSSWLRSIEARSVGTDEVRLKQISSLADDEIIRKWLWKVVIIGAPISFMALPILVACLSLIFSSLIMQLLWFFTKLGMSIILALFGLAIFLTWKKGSE